MRQVAGFDLFEVQFTKDGALHDRGEADALLAHVRDHAVTDLLVLAHGWNNDMREARTLYSRLLGSVAQVMPSAGPGIADRSWVVLGALWPSKKFADEQFIAGGAASVDLPAADEDLLDMLEDLKGVFDAEDADERLQEAKALVGQLETHESAQERFVDLVRGALPPDIASDEDAADIFLSTPGREVLQRLSTPDVPGDVPDEDTAPGGARGPGGAATMRSSATDSGVPSVGEAAGFFGDLFADMRGAARNLLNLATYYQMKARAGHVGMRGVHPLLRDARAIRSDVRLHLVGHSFGGRLAAAAALGTEDDPPLAVDSLTLLQAAFSHYGFADDYGGGASGLFRPVLARQLVRGPILVTHTVNDKAVGMAYPLASRLARQVGAGLGDAGDRYGGIGRNGAQKTPEARAGALLGLDGVYALDAGSIHNLRADEFIGNHSDVAGREVAHALLAAMSVI